MRIDWKQWLHCIATEPEYLDENQAYDDTTAWYQIATKIALALGGAGQESVSYSYTETGDRCPDIIEVTLSPFDWSGLEDDMDLERWSDAISDLENDGYLTQTGFSLDREYQDEAGIEFRRYSSILTPSFPERVR